MSIRHAVLTFTFALQATAYAGEAALPECQPRGGLPNLFAKLERHEPVRIAYLGGSITAASGWRVMTTAWFEEQYPQSKFTPHNAAHSGTTSDLACFRLQRDCLHFKPDLLFIEFAVNDGIATRERIHQGIEGVIRQARRANPNLDICLVYTLADGWLKALREGKIPHTYRAMDEVADHYDLPSIYLGKEVVHGVVEGAITFQGDAPADGTILFSQDGVHPLEEGHAFYRDAIARAMKTMESLGKEGPATMPAPLRADNFEYAHPTPLNRATLSEGWRKLDPKADPIAQRFHEKLPELYCANAPGESITVRFKGTSILLYDLVGPDCGQIVITIDDREPFTKARFDAWTTDHRVYYFIAATDLEDTEHTARFEISAEAPDKAAILSKRGITMDDPERFQGTAWYVGEVLVTGEVLPVE